ncbi:E3 ubiquitin-protein ligase TRIM33-like [Haliotis rubra]|uniref:E3 ubiquitin-protein ligase TRIM33-like n=1 Tax=Haliotis rubra TaxID=36100 RepID=UPI001EE60FF5|nr:E3 ubiquitin-protein ligase TRIM33-like [Haliotis rubra]
MSDLVSVAAIKDLLTECPICTEHFDDSIRIPRRMTCCVQSICQPCLETCSGGNTTISCPMCRHQHNLPGGVKSLPKETVILKTLDYLKIQKGLHLPCTDCPDKETAQAQCDNCGVFLCSICLNAHRRNVTTKTHTIVTFDEMKGRPVQSFRRRHQCSQHQQPLQFYCHTCTKVVCVSCTVVDHDKGKGHNVVSVDEAHQELSKSIEDVFAKMNEKSETLDKAEVELMKKLKNIQMSKRVATDDINKTFDDLANELKQRRSVLLSDVEHKSAQNLQLTKDALGKTRDLQTRVKSSIEYTKLMRSKADRIEDLQVMMSSVGPLSTMLGRIYKRYSLSGLVCTLSSQTYIIFVIVWQLEWSGQSRSPQQRGRNMCQILQHTMPSYRIQQCYLQARCWNGTQEQLMALYVYLGG